MHHLRSSSSSSALSANTGGTVMIRRGGGAVGGTLYEEALARHYASGAPRIMGHTSRYRPHQNNTSSSSSASAPFFMAGNEGIDDVSPHTPIPPPPQTTATSQFHTLNSFQHPPPPPRAVSPPSVMGPPPQQTVLLNSHAKAFWSEVANLEKRTNSQPNPGATLTQRTGIHLIHPHTNMNTIPTSTVPAYSPGRSWGQRVPSTETTTLVTPHTTVEEDAKAFALLMAKYPSPTKLQQAAAQHQHHQNYHNNHQHHLEHTMSGGGVGSSPPQPQEDDATSYTCRRCHAKGQHGKFCANCSLRLPDVEPCWRCNTTCRGYFCTTCGAEMGGTRDTTAHDEALRRTQVRKQTIASGITPNGAQPPFMPSAPWGNNGGAGGGESNNVKISMSEAWKARAEGTRHNYPSTTAPTNPNVPPGGFRGFPGGGGGGGGWGAVYPPPASTFPHGHPNTHHHHPPTYNNLNYYGVGGGVGSGGGYEIASPPFEMN